MDAKSKLKVGQFYVNYGRSDSTRNLVYTFRLSVTINSFLFEMSVILLSKYSQVIEQILKKLTSLRAR
jgi:hypothetical protein